MLLATTVALAALIGSSVLAAGAYVNKVTYSGQGLSADGFGGYDLNREICGVANGADIDGPYLLWVLTANKASNADITGPWGTVLMTKTSNGAFKYISGWYDPNTLSGNVSASYDGAAKNAQLVISHGCRPFANGAWCSPGFWRNAEDTAWTLIGVSKNALFNDTVVPNFYDTVSAANPTLNTVLTTPGANTFGTPSDPFGLNAFNATGAYLTNKIPGFSFSLAAMQENNESNTCPIDHHGNFKIRNSLETGGSLQKAPATHCAAAASSYCKVRVGNRGWGNYLWNDLHLSFGPTASRPAAKGRKVIRQKKWRSRRDSNPRPPT